MMLNIHKYPMGKLECYSAPTIIDKIKNYFKRRQKTKGANIMSNTMFKVGDRVRVVKNKLFDFDNYVGLVGTIIGYGKRNLTHDDAYNIRFDDESRASDYWWVDDELELAEFTKSDLKDGMVVMIRNGWKYLVVGDRLISEKNWLDISGYDDNLIDDTFAEYDIVEVYKVKPSCVTRVSGLFDSDNLELIWEREKKPTRKYKVGDKVKVRSDLESVKMYGTHHFVNGMKPLLGKVVTIENVGLRFDDYYIVDDPYRYLWTDEMFEGLVDYEEMTVAEIEKKLGYKVKIVDGE